MTRLPEPISSFTTFITQKISDTVATIPLDTTFADDGTDLNGLTIGFVADRGVEGSEEVIIGTVNTAGSELINCIRGVSLFDGISSVASLKQEHQLNASIAITSHPYLARSVRILNGTDTVDPDSPIEYAVPQAFNRDRQLVDKGFVENVITSVGGNTQLLVTDIGALNIGINSGRYFSESELKTFAGIGSVVTVDNATNFVELDPVTNTHSVNQVGFTDGSIPLAEVTTLSGDITAVDDRRPFFTHVEGDKEITTAYTYGATIAVGDAVYLNNTTNKLEIADASIEATATGPIWFALEAGVDTDTGKRVQTGGTVDNFNGTLVSAGQVFLSSTGGEVNSTGGTYRRTVGYSVDTTKFFIVDTFRPNELAGTTTDSTRTNYNAAMLFWDNVGVNWNVANADALVSGAITELHGHNAASLRVPVSLGLGAGIPAEPNNCQASGAVGDDSDFYVAIHTGTTPNRVVTIFRYSKDTNTGEYYYSGTSVELTESGSQEVEGDNFGIAVGSGFVWVTTGQTTGSNDIQIHRFARDLTGKTKMTISGTALTSGNIGFTAGDDSVLYVANTTTTETVAVYTISGTTATRGSDFTTTGSDGQDKLGFWYDGTDLVWMDASQTNHELQRWNVSGVQQTTSIRHIFGNGSSAFLTGATDPILGIPCGIVHHKTVNGTTSIFMLGWFYRTDQTSNQGSYLLGVAVTKP